MNPAGTSGTEGTARCALHPLDAAVATCVRCGNFVCEACRAGSQQGLCPSCRELVGEGAFPFNRQNWTFSALWDLAWLRFKAQGTNLSVGMLIVFVASTAANLVGSAVQQVVTSVIPHDSGAGLAVVMGGASVATSIVAGLVRGIFDVGFAQMVLLAIRGRPVEPNMVFAGFKMLDRYVRLVLVMVGIFIPIFVVLGAMVGVGVVIIDSQQVVALLLFVIAALALIVVGFFVGIPLAFSTFELVNDRQASAMEIVSRCFKLVQDNRWNVFGVQFIEGMVALVGLLACCVGIVPATALAQLLHVGLYLALRTGSELPEPATAPLG